MLDTALTVSRNFVSQGGSVDLTVTVKSSTAVANASRPATSAGSAAVPRPAPVRRRRAPTSRPGGAGVNFACSCTLDDLGEYIFSAGADRRGGDDELAPASSPSVLSSAGGGPNVVTWNLGSNTSAVGGSVITSGYTAGVYGLRGDNTTTFQKYDLRRGHLVGEGATRSANVDKGGALTTDGAGTIYQLTGDGKQTFHAYNIAANTWSARAPTGTNVGEGGCARRTCRTGGTKYVYALMGNGTAFKRYDVAANTWATMANTPANPRKGAALTTDGTNLYALQGDGRAGLLALQRRPRTRGPCWRPCPPNVNWGGSAGARRQLRLRDDRRRQDHVLPLRHRRQHLEPEGRDAGERRRRRALTTDGTFIYAFQGKTRTLLALRPRRQPWTALPPFVATTGPGRRARLRSGPQPGGAVHHR